ADRVDQVLEDVIALDLGHAEQLDALPAVQLVDRAREVGDLRRVDLGRPAGGDGELHVRRDRVVDGVEQVLQIPPAHADRAHGFLPVEVVGRSPARIYITLPRTESWDVVVLALLLILLFAAAPAQAAGSGGAEATPFSVAP